MITMNNLAESIRNNDLKRYQKERYPSIPEGEPVIFNDENFSNVNFGQFSAGFFEFIHCNLDNVSELYGQPITLHNCSARGIDLRGIRAIIKAAGCDFTGVQYDHKTELAYSDTPGVASEFTDCVIDQEAKEHFTSQGVIFR